MAPLLNKYTPMAGIDKAWSKVVPYFSKHENWGDYDKIDARLVFALYDVRRITGRKINIHCGYEARKTGYHPMCLAVDFDIAGMHVIDQFLICSRFDVFNGIGIYHWWNNPGIHCDTRPNKLKNNPEARWISLGPGEYVPLTVDNLKGIIK